MQSSHAPVAMMSYQVPPSSTSHLPLGYPSVLQGSSHIDMSTVSLEGFSSSIMPDSPNSPNRRQRISMACQHCRHRKIRCCGGKPCRNCDKVGKTCDYAPVPEEVNRATREKKAASKAARQTITPTTGYAPYFMPVPMPAAMPVHVGYELNYGMPPVQAPGPVPSSSLLAPSAIAAGSRPMHIGHRRSVSTPNFEAPWSNPPPAPQLTSPPQFDLAPQWTFNGSNLTPSTAPTAYMPTVEQQQPIYRPGMGHLPSAYSTPNLQQHQFQQQPSYLRPPLPLTPIQTAGRSNTTSTTTTQSSPNTPAPGPYYAPGTGYPTPVYSPVSLMPMNPGGKNNSPTLAPEYSVSGGGLGKSDALVGLGIMGTTKTPRQDLPSSISDMNLGLSLADDHYFNPAF